MLVRRRGQLAHPQAMLDAGVGLDLLVRRLVHRRQQYALEVELHEGLLRADQVPDVRRVEGPAEDADAQRVNLGPGPRRRPGT
jgi:hypothetical protein